MRSVYLDNNATTPVDPRVLEGMLPYFKEKFGRIRSVKLGPDGMFYLTTSNRDGRGSPDKDDDRIIRVNPNLAF